MSLTSAFRLPVWLVTLLFIATTLPAVAVAPPTITSFTPQSLYEGQYGVLYPVTINGTNFDNVTAVNIGGRSASFVVNSSIKITAYVAASASTNFIFVTTPGGTAYGSVAFTVKPIPRPTITSFSPTSAYAGQTGVVVTIIGTGFLGKPNTIPASGVKAVSIGGLAAASFRVVNDTTLTAVVAVGASTYGISVTNASGTAYSTGNFTILPIPAPTITSFTPTSAYVGETGRVITITGTNFKGVGALAGLIKNTSVKIGGTTASINVVNDTTITATVPVGAIYPTYWISVTTNGGTAYSKDNFIIKPIPAPTIASFSPTSAYAGETNRIITITGTNFKGTGELIPLIRVLDVRIGGSSASFNVLSDTSITTVVPASVLYPIYWISVTTTGGTVYSKDNFTVKSVPAPTITSFSPSTGSAGETVRITGTNFMGSGALSGLITVISVKIGGTDASFNVDSDTSITAVVPANVAYPIYWISVTTSGGTVFSGSNFTVKAASAPTISSFTPASGKVGDLVTLTGTNFTSATEVKFAGTVAVFTVVSATSITANVPSGAVTGKISVTTPGGTASSSTVFTVSQPPSITSFTPTSGAVRDTVTITGVNLTGASSVMFYGDVSAAITSVSATSIVVTVPVGAATGPISVITPSGTAVSDSSFTVIPVPTITSFTPTSGSIGDLVTITGTNFTAASAVNFAGTAAVFTVLGGTSITANVPSGAVTGRITISTPYGIATSAEDFVVIQAPSIISFSPTSGRVGTIVTITGANFGQSPVVQFNGTTVVSYRAIADTSITVVVPDGASTGRISVTTSNGTATSVDDFTVYAQIAITGFTPTSGIVGTEVTIHGSGFTGVTGVSFNGTPATQFTVESDALITAVVPEGARTGLISVINPTNTATTTDRFTVYQQPSISSFLPTSGKVGDVVTITGTNLTDIRTISFNGTVTTVFTVDSDTSITVTVPSGATTGLVEARNPVSVTTCIDLFTVYQQPTISSIQPQSGVVGDVITITGTNLIDITVMDFNGTDATAFTVDSDTSITATVPSGATTGTIDLRNPAYTTTSAESFTVYQKPTISSFTPESGVVGDIVTISGTGFTGVFSVVFTSAMATITSSSDTSLTVTVPNGSTTGPITITTPAGSTSSQRDYTVYQQPTISSFSPGSGLVGYSVTISGTGFTGVREVLFGSSVASISASTDTSITVTVPDGATTGRITVTTPAGSTASARDFTVYQKPAISSFAPESGAVGQVVTITGNSFVGVTRVIFNTTTTVTYTVNSETSITATVPSGATTGKISVSTLYGPATSAVDFVVNQPPAISSFTPSGGAVGISVTINGSNLMGATAVYLGGILQSTFTVVSNTMITTTVPSGAQSGPISVTTPSGTATSLNPFFVAPSITSFTPTIGPIGTVVTITGTNFFGVGQVTFNGVTAAISSVTPTTIVATVPTGATSGPISVSSQGGVATSAAYFMVQPYGVVVFWGKNGSGQGNLPTPNLNFMGISTGWNHVAGLKQDGSVVCWGYNVYGECNVPAPNLNFTAVSAGYFHTVGLKQDGSLVCWGNNSYGLCTVPAPNQGFTAASSRYFHNVGLKTDGTVVCWGDNSYGQCAVPMPNQNFTAVSAGQFHTASLKSDGSVVCWGYNNAGQCAVPVPNQGFIATSAGAYHTAGLKSDGSIVCWGDNYYGECTVPAPNQNFVAVSAGSSHTVGLKRDGTVVCWGTNTNGECNVPYSNSGYFAIGAGSSYTCAIRNP